MASRLLAAALIAAILAGLASDARAQKRAGVARNSRKGKAGPEAAGDGRGGTARIPLAGEAATAAPSGPTSTDPFDVAAGNSEAPAGQTGESQGQAKSAADPAGMSQGKTERATFGAGCFWHVEQAFEWLPGVKSAVSGYAGGWVPRPSYEEVHEGITGHAEVVQVEYDPSVITYEQLLNVFWRCHDPTQLNCQGPDIGPQYRSVIFYHNEAQRRAALKSYRDLIARRIFPRPIVTQLLPMKAFYRAEDYHQNYYGGKDDPRAPRPARSHRARKPAARTKPAIAAKPGAAQAAARSVSRPGDENASSAGPHPGGGGRPES